MTSTQPTVLCVGAANADTIAVVPSYPDPDERVVATEIVEAGGGPAATAAVTLARLGVPARLCALVGDDAPGRFVLDALRGEGVDVTAVRVEKGRTTARSVVVVDASTGSRAILTVPAPVPTLADAPLDGVDWVHADHAGWPAVVEALASAAERPWVSVDAGNPVPGLDLSVVDLYVPSVPALLAGRDRARLDDALDDALAAGAGAVVATDGQRGSYLADADGIRHVPAFEVPVRSTLGAGDVFHGALLAAIDDGLDEAVRFASAVAALSCRGIDGRSGIPSRAETEELLAGVRT